jgi:hypothetical protein
VREQGFPLSCRFFLRGEPPHKNAASEAPFQDRGARRAGWVDLRYKQLSF